MRYRNFGKICNLRYVQLLTAPTIRCQRKREYAVMNQFTLRPECRSRLRKAVYVRYTGIACLAAFLLLLVYSSNTWPFDSPSPDTPNYTTLIVFLVVMLMWDLNDVNATASAFKLTISEEAITSENKSVISIPSRKVRSITRYTNGSYVILGENALRPITIPVAIEREAEMEKLLTAVTGLEIQPQNFQSYQVFLIAFALPVVMLGTLFVNNKHLATGLGIACAGSILYGWGMMQWGSAVDKKIRRLSHLILVLVILVIIRIVWLWK